MTLLSLLINCYYNCWTILNVLASFIYIIHIVFRRDDKHVWRCKNALLSSFGGEFGSTSQSTTYGKYPVSGEIPELIIGLDSRANLHSVPDKAFLQNPKESKYDVKTSGGITQSKLCGLFEIRLKCSNHTHPLQLRFEETQELPFSEDPLLSVGLLENGGCIVDFINRLLKIGEHEIPIYKNNNMYFIKAFDFNCASAESHAQVISNISKEFMYMPNTYPASPSEFKFKFSPKVRILGQILLSNLNCMSLISL